MASALPWMHLDSRFGFTIQSQRCRVSPLLHSRQRQCVGSTLLKSESSLSLLLSACRLAKWPEIALLAEIATHRVPRYNFNYRQHQNTTMHNIEHFQTAT